MKIKNKVSQRLTDPLYIEIILIDLESQTIYTKHLREQVNFINIVEKKIYEKTKFTLKSKQKI